MAYSLSVNINKFATLRNSRGTGHPDLCAAIDTIVAAGAHGITIHPREDQRHITRDDIFTVSAHLRKNHPGIELNIEGDARPALVADILEVRPDQATLVPVRPGELTSDHGYDFTSLSRADHEAITAFKKAGIRVSMFAWGHSSREQLEAAAACGTDRIEIYTGPYAHDFADPERRSASLDSFARLVKQARALDLGINAGHDLDLENLPGLVNRIVVDEFSIGHMLICRALETGLHTAVQEFLQACTPA